MKYENVAAEILSGLGLTAPPIALTFVEAVPAGIQTFDQKVPSACALWRKAETSVFYASAETHFNCPIGAMTMGFEMPASVHDSLMGVVEKMLSCGYLSPDETARIPSIKKKKNGIVYGPLKDFPVEPELILMWLTPRQAMLYSESVGTCHWNEELPTAVFGRPACAALPVAFGHSQSVLSFGCTGMRTFTEVSEDRLLAVLPGCKLQAFVKALESIAEANATMRKIYQEHKEKFAGSKPMVQDAFSCGVDAERTGDDRARPEG